MRISSFFAGFTHVYPAGEKMAAKARPKPKRAPAKPPARPLIPGDVTALVKAGAPYRFQPGQSGNPSGRTSYSALSSAYKHQLGCQLDAETAQALKLSPNATVAEAIAVVLSRCALAGDVNAARELCNRVEGQAPAFLGIAMGAPRPKQEITFIVKEEQPKFAVRPEMREFLDDVRSVMVQESSTEIIEAAAKLARALVQKYGTAKA
jgi:hypothetical protein